MRAANRAAPARRSACRRRAAARPTRCRASASSPIRRRANAASSSSDSSAVPFAPFQLCASSCRKISNASRAASRRALVDDIDRAERGQAGSSPAAASCRSSRSACARISPSRNGRARSESVSIWPARAPSAAIIAREGRGVAVEQLELDHVRQRALVRDRIEERRHHGVDVAGIDHRARRRTHIRKAAPRGTRARTARCAARAAPRGRPVVRRPSQASSTWILAKPVAAAAQSAAGCMNTFAAARRASASQCGDDARGRARGFRRKSCRRFPAFAALRNLAPRGLAVRLRKSHTAPPKFPSNINDQAIRDRRHSRNVLKAPFSLLAAWMVRQDNACARPTSSSRAAGLPARRAAAMLGRAGYSRRAGRSARGLSAGLPRREARRHAGRDAAQDRRSPTRCCAPRRSTAKAGSRASAA